MGSSHVCSPGKEFPVSCTLPAPCLPDWPWQQPLLAAQAPRAVCQSSSPTAATQGPAQLTLSQQGLNRCQHRMGGTGVRSGWCCTPTSPALVGGPESACGTSRGQEDLNMGTSFLLNFWQKCYKKQSFHGCTGSSLHPGKEGRAIHTHNCSTIIFIGNISGAPVNHY